MERLKVVLKRIKQDREDGIHPYVDPALDAELTKKLKKVLRLNIDAKKSSGEAKPEKKKDAGSDGEEGAAFNIQDELLKGKDEEEQELAKALWDLIDERISKERQEDKDAGFTHDRDSFSLNEQDLAELKKLYDDETGAKLNHIEDETEYAEAWLEWVKEKIPAKLSATKTWPKTPL